MSEIYIKKKKTPGKKVMANTTQTVSAKETRYRKGQQIGWRYYHCHQALDAGACTAGNAGWENGYLAFSNCKVGDVSDIKMHKVGNFPTSDS